MPSTNPSSPYVGLRPFREEDFALFFGRDREIRVIAANLQARPLTVLYGASGVGKSSVLQAGVLRRLKQEAGASVLYFRDWQTDSLLNDILRKAYEFLPADSTAGTANTSEGASQPIKFATERAFLLLDQFEEFLLYHANDNLGEEFDSVLSRIVNRKDCPVNVLIGIRDDSLFKLDRRLGMRIPNLLRDTLEVERMAPAGARSAIEKPLAVFSKMFGNDTPYDIEPALVDEICQQVLAGHVLLSESLGIGSKSGRQKENRIETAYLQLVLSKLWEEELLRNSHTLRLRTLQELGGADNIVRSHVNSVMNQLASKRERAIAANMFRYLVTPSRSKIAQATTDLVSYAERPEREVKKVLDALTDRSESRILRRLSDPEQYEIFHDVLAQPLLDWRRGHAEAQASRRLWRFIAGAGVVAILFAVLAAYALVERHYAKDAAAVALASSLNAQEAEKKAQEALAQHKADEAALAGRKAEAEQLRSQAAEFARQAANINQSYQSQRQALDSTSNQALTSVQGANHDRDVALQTLAATQKERDDYKSRLEAAQQQIKELQKPAKSASESSPQALVSPSPAKGKPLPPGGASEVKKDVSPALAPSSGLTASDSSSPGDSTPTAPTEVCARLTQDLSMTTGVGTPITAVIFSPREGKGYKMEGNLIGKDDARVKGKSVLRIQFYKIVREKHTNLAFYHSSSTASSDITAAVRSVTSSDKKAQLAVDGQGNIVGPGIAFIPKGSAVCSSVSWPFEPIWTSQ